MTRAFNVIQIFELPPRLQSQGLDALDDDRLTSSARAAFVPRPHQGVPLPPGVIRCSESCHPQGRVSSCGRMPSAGTQPVQSGDFCQGNDYALTQFLKISFQLKISLDICFSLSQLQVHSIAVDTI